MKAVLVAFLLATACASHPALYPGSFAVDVDQLNAAASAEAAHEEDLEVTLRAAFASRFENVDFFPARTDKRRYDAFVSVMMTFENVLANPRTGERQQRVGLQYEIEDAGGVFATGFVPMNLAKWPPSNATSESVYHAFSVASDELAERVLHDLKRRGPPRPPDRRMARP